MKWYAVLIMLAIVIGILLCKRESGKYGIKFEQIIDLAIYLIPISIISARLYYVAFSYQNYIHNPIEILNLRSGGLAIYGGIIGGLITCMVYSKIKKISLLDILDYIVPYVALGQCIGRWGNFINVEAYGSETTSFLRMGIIENGLYKEVHPTFLYESICTLAIFILLTLLKNKRKYKGQITAIYLLAYSFVRIFIEGLRTDSLMFYNLRVSQILSIIIFVIMCSILAYKKIKRKNS
ncbi:MAG: prolipoprotein diacylglyceryl transferase [Lachnospiraceae bacterium]|nr:prolipoprotein diacylglyceryl transferase [Lachnospiraceae bacterium]